MSEMVERVARALCECNKRNHPAGYPEGWMKRFVDENWHHFGDGAKAAIEAMREPTDLMIDVAWPELVPQAQSSPQEVWVKMIDEALK